MKQIILYIKLAMGGDNEFITPTGKKEDDNSYNTIKQDRNYIKLTIIIIVVKYI